MIRKKIVSIFASSPLIALPLVTLSCGEQFKTDLQRANELIKTIPTLSGNNFNSAIPRSINIFEETPNEGEVTLDIVARFGLNYELPTHLPFDAMLWYKKTRLKLEIDDEGEYIVQFFIKIDSTISDANLSKDKIIYITTSDVLTTQKYANYLAAEQLSFKQKDNSTSTIETIDGLVNSSVQELTNEVLESLGIIQQLPTLHESFEAVYTISKKTKVVGRGCEYDFSSFLREKGTGGGVQTEGPYRKPIILRSADLYTEEQAKIEVDALKVEFQKVIDGALESTASNTNAIIDGVKTLLSSTTGAAFHAFTSWADKELYMYHSNSSLQSIGPTTSGKYSLPAAFTTPLRAINLNGLTVKTKMHSTIYNEFADKKRAAQGVLSFYIEALNSEYRAEVSVPMATTKVYSTTVASDRRDAESTIAQMYFTKALSADGDISKVYSKKTKAELLQIQAKYKLSNNVYFKPGTNIIDANLYNWYQTKKYDHDNNPDTPDIDVTDVTKPNMMVLNKDKGKSFCQELGLSESIEDALAAITYKDFWETWTIGISMAPDVAVKQFRTQFNFSKFNVNEWVKDNPTKDINTVYRTDAPSQTTGWTVIAQPASSQNIYQSDYEG